MAFHAVLSHSISVALPLERAMRQFTPIGERAWVGDRWNPRFPSGEQGDGDTPGTVFVTDHAGDSTFWVVVDRSDDVVRYARATPGFWAGTVEVRCTPTPDRAGTTAEVTYHLTALSEAGEAELDAFVLGYEAEIGEWERLIADAVAAGRAL
jgi:hypothetical protein